MSFDRDGFYKEVGLRLQGTRKRKGLTQEEIAAEIGITRATYANVESGRARTTVDVLWRAAVVLGVSLQLLTPEPLTPQSSPSPEGPETLPTFVTGAAAATFFSRQDS